jgi:phosphohistidine phosphatase
MLCLIHHGHAIGPEVDAMRPLTERGRDNAARLADEVARRGLKPDVIWHSGKLRARQTAEAFWRVCNPLAEFAAVRGLQPDDPPVWMRDQLAGDTRSIFIVSHMPYLPRLLQALRGADVDAPAFDFPLHGCVALEPNGLTWKECWRMEGRGEAEVS